jgi:ribosomal protein S18 acetylase RimI-like enzyme
MLSSVDIIRAAPETRAAAADIQARAFFDDPVITFTLPDAAARRERLPWLMGIGIGCGLRHGRVDTTAGTMRGHAVWFHPGATSVTPEMLNEAGFAEARERIGERALARFGAFMDAGSEIHDRLMPGPHWYLMILGVDPPHQGQGLGGALIAPTLARADAGGLPCYLDTSKESNLAFYRKHGFEVRHETDIVDGGDSVHVWMMVREPE